MKKLVVGICSLVLSSAVWAAEGTGEGTINKVKSGEEKLNISHGPIEGVMESMTMDFQVMDPSMLDDVAAGDKVRFTVEEAAGGAFVITDIEVTGKGAVAADDGHGHQH